MIHLSLSKNLARITVLFSVLLASPVLLGQGTLSDYERSGSLRKITSNKVFKTNVNAHWIAESGRFWYRNDLPGGRKEFILVDAGKGERREAFDHERLARALGKSIGKEVAADRLPVDRLRFGESGSDLLFASRGKKWRCSLKTYEIKPLPDDAEIGGTLEPAGRMRRSSGTGAETSITFFNRSGGGIEIYWVTTDGQRRHYTSLEAGGRHEQHTYAGHAWLVTDDSGKKRSLFVATDSPAEAVIEKDTLRERLGRSRSRRGAPGEQSVSPDGKWSAFFKDHSVFVRDMSSDREILLSDDGTAEDRYEGRLNWSPDSKNLAVLRTRPAEEHKVHVVESSPDDQVQPKLHTRNYLKPGDRVAVSRPCLFDVVAGKEIPISGELFTNPWSVQNIRWAPDSSRFTFVYNQRGHQALRVLGVNAGDGSVHTLVDERSETFIHYSGKYFLHWIDDGDELIWMSERDGWNHLYLYDTAFGTLKNQITIGDWLVRGVERVDEENRQIWFRAGGILPDQDPYHVHFARVNFDGTGLTVLTVGDGTHDITFSPDGRWFIDRYSRVDQPPVSELRRSSDGKLVCELERADWTALLETGWKPPIRFSAKGRDGASDIYGVIYRPSRFDRKALYPVIECIYAGPHSSHVPKSFRNFHGPQAMAELGFIVVQIDGMGTSNRSKKFHDVCWKNLADAGLPDRILWIKAAAEKHPYMDITRVGIYGGSAGGQNAAAAVMVHGDFYDVAVADCGCHDNRMDKIWWNEQWMGWPIGPEYEANSNVTLAKGLKGKLLLIVGELDSNVDPASTMQVVDALVKADKDFDLLVIPGAGHGAAGTPYGRRRQADYFVRHLLGVEPRRRP